MSLESILESYNLMYIMRLISHHESPKPCNLHFSLTSAQLIIYIYTCSFLLYVGHTVLPPSGNCPATWWVFKIPSLCMMCSQTYQYNMTGNMYIVEIHLFWCIELNVFAFLWNFYWMKSTIPPTLTSNLEETSRRAVSMS